MSNWITIVEPVPEEEANELLVAWKKENHDLVNHLAEEDVLKDTIRSEAGDLVRYRLRRR